MRGRREKVVVNGFELVRQRVNARDGQGEIGVVLEGQREAHGLDAQAEHFGVAVKGLGVGGGFEELELFLGQDDVHHLAGLEASADKLDRVAHRDRDDDLDGLGEHRAAKDFVRLELVEGHGWRVARALNPGGLRAR